MPARGSLAAPFGICYADEPFPINVARPAGDHPLTEKLTALCMIAGNGLPLSLSEDAMLAELGGQAALGLVDYGAAGGQVLALADLGSLDLYDKRERERDNFNFLRNLARYARER